jgi:uncharacterized protein involved in exopolysaccharide biosynthesis
MIRANELAVVERESQRPFPTLRDLVAVLFRQRWAMLVAVAAVIVLVVVSGLWIPKYEAQMKIVVRRQRSDAIVSSSANAPSQYSSDQVSEEDLNSEVELLNSQDLLRKVVLSTGLNGNPGSRTDRGSKVRIAMAVRNLGKELKIEPIRKSNVILVRYQAGNPEMAAEVLKALAAEYTEKHLEVHRSTGEFKFFDQQMDEYQKGLDQAQAKLTEFTKETGVVSADLERDSALKQADEFEATARQAGTTALETRHRISVLRAQLQSIPPRVTTVVRTSDNPQLLEHMKSTLLDLQLKKTELLTKYEPAYRLVQEVDQQIAEAKTAIDAEEERPIREESSDQDPNYQRIQAELMKTEAELDGLKAREASAGSIARQYHEYAQRLDQDGLVQQGLLWAVKTQQENYRLYVQKREEARISAALDQRGILNVAVAEQPLVPALPSRSLPRVAFLTVLLAGAFSLSTAFVIDHLDPSFRTPDEAVYYLGKPVLAALPKGGS